jgi:hypothetical protein
MAATAATTMVVTVAAMAAATGAASAAMMATAANGVGECGGGDGNGDSCRSDGGVLALRVLPQLQINTMKYKLLSQSHPRLVKMCFLVNRRVTAKVSTYQPTILSFCKYFNCKECPGKPSCM